MIRPTLVSCAALAWLACTSEPQPQPAAPPGRLPPSDQAPTAPGIQPPVVAPTPAPPAAPAVAVPPTPLVPVAPGQEPAGEPVGKVAKRGKQTGGKKSVEDERAERRRRLAEELEKMMSGKQPLVSPGKCGDPGVVCDVLKGPDDPLPAFQNTPGRE